MKPQQDRLSARNLAAFASAEVPMAAFLTPLVVFIPAYYSGHMGLGLSLVGIVFAFTKLWDIVTDPIAAYVCERVGPGKGRWRFWMLVSLPIMLLGVARIFSPPEEVTWSYFAFWMVFLYIGWTLLTISHISWGLELSDDYHERARVAAYRQCAALLGGLIVVFLPIISDRLVGGDESDRISLIGNFVLAVLPLTVLLAICVTPVTRTGQAPAPTGHRWNDVFTVFARTPLLRALLYANLCVLLGISSMSSVLLFYVENVLLLGDWATFAVVPLLFSGLLFLPVLKRLTLAVGKERTYRYALLFQIAVQPLLLFVPQENLLVTICAFLLLGGINGAAVFLPQAMLADLKDVDTGAGAERTGIYVALLQSTSKVAAALAVAVTFLLLPLTGFDPSPDVQNTAGSLNGLRTLIVLLPTSCFILALLAMRNFSYGQAQARQA